MIRARTFEFCAHFMKKIWIGQSFRDVTSANIRVDISIEKYSWTLKYIIIRTWRRARYGPRRSTIFMGCYFTESSCELALVFSIFYEYTHTFIIIETIYFINKQYFGDLTKCTLSLHVFVLWNLLVFDAHAWALIYVFMKEKIEVPNAESELFAENFSCIFQK